MNGRLLGRTTDAEIAQERIDKLTARIDALEAELVQSNKLARELVGELKALFDAADAACERADFDLVDSGQWQRLGAATDHAIPTIHRAHVFLDAAKAKEAGK